MDVIIDWILLALLLCTNVICVFFSIFYAFRKSKKSKYAYNVLDKISVITNILIIVLGMPYLFMGMFLALIVQPEVYTNIFFTFLECLIIVSTELSMSIVSLSLAQSAVFRHNGKSIKGFLIQFVGVAWMVLTMLLFRTLT